MRAHEFIDGWDVAALLLRALTPLLRPFLRANHRWAIAHAVRGLEPFVKAHAGAPTP